MLEDGNGNFLTGSELGVPSHENRKKRFRRNCRQANIQSGGAVV
jgi:hypothetical protein